MTKFNLSRYQELLAKEDSSTNDVKALFKDPIFKELLSLRSSVERQVFYNNKKNYFVLIQDYLGERINPNVFRGQFIGIVNKDLTKSHKILHNFEELATFSIDLELDDFSSLFEKIHQICLYAFEFEDQDDAMSEDKFRDSIEKIFFKIRKYLDE
jgi:hypothetical protein